MPSNLREQLDSLADRATTGYPHVLVRAAARIALEAVGCRFGYGGVTCLSEGTPSARWCNRCALLASLNPPEQKEGGR